MCNEQPIKAEFLVIATAGILIFQNIKTLNKFMSLM